MAPRDRHRAGRPVRPGRFAPLWRTLPLWPLWPLWIAACSKPAPRQPLGIHAFGRPVEIELDGGPTEKLVRLVAQPEVWIVAEKVPAKNWKPGPEEGSGIWRAGTRFPPAGKARVGPPLEMIKIGGGAAGDGVHPAQLSVGSMLLRPEGLYAKVAGDVPNVAPLSYPTLSEHVAERFLSLNENRTLAPVELRLARHTRQAAILPLPFRISFTVDLPERATLSTAFALRNLAVRPREAGLQVVPLRDAGARFRIELTDVTRRTHTIFEQEIEARPLKNLEKFVDVRVDLAAFGGNPATLHLIAEPSEPPEDPGVLAFGIWGEPVVATDQDQGVPNVVVILLDTLRADRLGCYGWARAQTDRLDQLARQGVLYTDAMSAAPWTLPAHASLFSSNYLSEHMLWTERRLGDEHTTIAEVLKERGYSTAAITEGGFVRSAYGLAQGFGLFEAETRDAAGTFASAREWIEATTGPYFAFVQTYQVHSPYDPPDDYRHLVRPYDGEMKAAVHVPDYDWGHPKKRATAPGPQDRTYIEDLYDGEIAYVDGLVGDFLDFLEDRGDLGHTLVIVTSDHGDEFFDHGQAGHGWSLYEEQLHIPLIVYLKGVFEGGQILAHPVHLVDIGPTIAQVTRSPIPADWSGAPLGFAAPRIDRPLFAPFWTRFHPERGKPAVALREGRLKYIDYPAGHRPLDRIRGPALFDLEADPEEKNNLLTDANKGAWEAKVRKAFRRYPERGSASEVDAALVDQEELEALGYVEGSDDEEDPTSPQSAGTEDQDTADPGASSDSGTAEGR